MGIKCLLRIAAAIILVAVCTEATAATTPAIVAKRAQAARVLNEIYAIDQQVNTISEQYDGAMVRLTALRREVRTENVAFRRAQSQYHQAERRAAHLLVYLYTSGRSSSLDVILGATSFSQLLKIADAEDAIGNQAVLVASQTDSDRLQVRVRLNELELHRAQAELAVSQIAEHRHQILHELAERQRLLVGVEAQVQTLERQQAILQARLAAQARARLAAEAAAAARAEKLAAAQAAAAAQQRAQANENQPAATPTDPTGSSGATTDPASTVPSTTQTTTTSTDQTFSALPTGYPQAATIALRYLGVPYVWGGESPAGFDCSGLVEYVYAQLGIDLPHYAAAQYTYGVAVPRAELEPGDLVFFANLDHVGIYIGDDEYVDAPYTGVDVRIDSLDTAWAIANYVGARRI